MSVGGIQEWSPVEADASSIAEQYPEPLVTLSEGTVPAFILRGAYPKSVCRALMDRFESRGYFSRETVDTEPQLSGGSYLDLGTSLGPVSYTHLPLPTTPYV